MNLGRAFGRFQYIRGKSQFWIEGVKGWIVPAGVAGGFANKVFDVSPHWSLAIGIGLVLIVEVLGNRWGTFLWNRGGVEEEYTLAMEKDPYKLRQIEFQAKAITLLREIATSVKAKR